MSDDVTKAVTTTYTNNTPRGGAVVSPDVPPAQRTEELGVSGLKGARPMEGWLYDEFLPQLRGLRGAQLYREMQDNDPIIGAAIFAFTMLLRSVDWSVVSADDSTAAEQAKEWVEGVLFKDMLTPFGDVISDILSFIPFGFAPAEVTYKIRRGEKRDPRKSSQFDDGTIGVMKIGVRAQDTIWRWHFDDYGELMALEQFRMGQLNAMIPAEKLLMFRTQATLNNPEGRSVLRNSYRTYTRKNTIEEAEGRAAIRSAGIVVMRIPSQYLDPSASGDELATANAYRAIATKVAQDAMGSVVIPSDVDPNTKTPIVSLDYVATEGTRPVDMSAIVERYDKRMLSSMLADFILLGQQAVGSFALSDSKTALFAKACGAFLSVLEDQFNRVLLTRLWRLNAFKPELKPRLKPGDLEAVDLDKLGMFILRMAQSGAQLFPDPDLENEVRDLAGLPAAVEQG
jgi:hypothetical protein